MSPPPSRRFPIRLAVLIAVAVVLAAAGPCSRALVGGRVRAAAAARGLDARWAHLAVALPMEVRFRDGAGRLAQLPGANFYRRVRDKFGRLAH